MPDKGLGRIFKRGYLYHREKNNANRRKYNANARDFTRK